MKKFLRLGGLAARLREIDHATVSQWAYIAEAAFEYFISLTISGAFLTLLVKQLKVSDALTGIISSVTILACTMQIFAVSFVRRRRSIRTAVVFMQTIQQLLYGGLFLLPFVPIGDALKTGVFVAVFLFSAILTNLVAPAKFNWMMFFVAPQNRGIFTAHKEMLSLLTGLAYNYGMSRLVDHYNNIGRPEVGLRLCAVAIFICMLLHLASLLTVHDAPEVLAEVKKTDSLKTSLRTNWSNKSFRRILVIVVGWNFAAYLSTAYHSVYLLQELSCSVTYIALVGIVASVVRMLFSAPIGRYSDKKTFAKGVDLGFVLAGAAFALLIFWVPANGKVLYFLFQMPYAVAMACLSGGMLNIVFQYVPAQDRVGAMGLYSAMGGIAGFLGSLAGGAILQAVQDAGNRLLGFSMYGQQFLSLLSFVMLVGLIVYMRTVIEKMKLIQE